jgi:hypothetical protein
VIVRRNGDGKDRLADALGHVDERGFVEEAHHVAPVAEEDGEVPAVGIERRDERDRERVDHRRRAVRLREIQSARAARRLQPLHFAHVLVERHHARAVARREPRIDGSHAAPERGEQWPLDAAAQIDDERDVDRKRLTADIVNRLDDAAVADFEVRGGEVSDGAIVVADRDVDRHRVDGRAEDGSLRRDERRRAEHDGKNGRRRMCKPHGLASRRS